MSHYCYDSDWQHEPSTKQGASNCTVTTYAT